MGPARCYPFQHTINVLAGAALGPWWAAGTAFATNLLRNMAGTGTFFAFPGSIPGAIAAGLAPDFSKTMGRPGRTSGDRNYRSRPFSFILGPAMGKAAGFSAIAGAFFAAAPGALIGMGLLHILAKTPCPRFSGFPTTVPFSLLNKYGPRSVPLGRLFFNSGLQTAFRPFFQQPP